MNQPDSNDNLTLALRRMHRWRMAFFGLVLMISGSVLGVAVTTLVLRPKDRPRWPDPVNAALIMTTRLKEELGLSAEQEEKIKTILQTQMQTLDEMRKAAFTQIETVMQATEDEISKVLSQEQRKQLREVLERMKGEFPRGMRRGPGGGPGGFGDRRGPFGGADGDRGPGEPRGDWPGPGGRHRPRRGQDSNGLPMPMEERPAPEPNQL